MVKKGGTAFFDCVYQNVDVIEWYFKDVGPLESNNRITLHPNGTLEINDVQESDQGMYNCVGIRGESTEVPQSYCAELKVACKQFFKVFFGVKDFFLEISDIHNFTKVSFEPILPEDSKHVIGEGSYFQLTCLEPKSLPLAKKFWLKPSGHTVRGSFLCQVLIFIRYVYKTDIRQW